MPEKWNAEDAVLSKIVMILSSLLCLYTTKRPQDFSLRHLMSELLELERVGYFNAAAAFALLLHLNLHRDSLVEFLAV